METPEDSIPVDSVIMGMLQDHLQAIRDAEFTINLNKMIVAKILSAYSEEYRLGLYSFDGTHLVPTNRDVL